MSELYSSLPEALAEGLYCLFFYAGNVGSGYSQHFCYLLLAEALTSETISQSYNGAFPFGQTR